MLIIYSGWQNTGTYGSVIAYNLYWIFVTCGFIAMRFNEQKGHWPFMKLKYPEAADESFDIEHGELIATDIHLNSVNDSPTKIKVAGSVEEKVGCSAE